MNLPIKIIISFLLIILLIPSTFTNAATRKELQNQLQNLTNDIDKAKKEFNNLEAQKKDLNNQVSTVKSEISKIESLINQTQGVINDLLIKIPQTQEKIKSLEEQMYKLYKEIQFYSATSKAELLLTSKSFSDLVARLYGINAVQNEVEKVSGELKDALDLLEDQKKAQEELLTKQNETKFILNSKKSSLDQLIQETQNKQEEYEKKINERASQAQKVQDDLAKLPQEIRTYIFRNGGNTQSRGDANGPCYFYEPRVLVYPDDYFQSPTTGAYTDNFSCYPWSWDWRRNGHDGIDIANGSGTPIVATADGTAVAYHPDFGNSVVLKHDLPSGQRVYSLYAHLRDRSPLSIGQKVKKGQVVGLMGSTGFSTGPHLHFMIISDTYEKYGPYCSYGSRMAKCYNPAKLIGL
ncbi:MAG: murein hydrolase activator EnvC family protein [Patescibacteria group bacterium]